MNPKVLNKKDVERARDYLMILGDLAERFSTIERSPRYTDGDRENDVEHSFHLALSSTEIAAVYFPELDLGLVTQFSLVHDFPEIYTGDVPTFAISDDNRSKKELAEQYSTERLFKELPPFMAQLLVRYEEQVEPEARFVRYMDKIMPGIINIIGGEASTFLSDNEVRDLSMFNEGIESGRLRLQSLISDFPFLDSMLDLLQDDLREHFFPKK